MVLGLANTELVLAALLFHFDWRLQEGMAAEEMDMTEAVGITAPPRFNLVFFPITRLQCQRTELTATVVIFHVYCCRYCILLIRSFLHKLQY